MSSDAVRRSSQPTRIKTPDQLQQARRQDASRPVETSGPEGERGGGSGEEGPRPEGILGQLETERAHD